MRGEGKNKMGERDEENGGGRGKEGKGKRGGSTFSLQGTLNVLFSSPCSLSVPRGSQPTRLQKAPNYLSQRLVSSGTACLLPHKEKHFFFLYN